MVLHVYAGKALSKRKLQTHPMKSEFLSNGQQVTGAEAHCPAPLSTSRHCMASVTGNCVRRVTACVAAPLTNVSVRPFCAGRCLVRWHMLDSSTMQELRRARMACEKSWLASRLSCAPATMATMAASSSACCTSSGCASAHSLRLSDSHHCKGHDAADTRAVRHPIPKRPLTGKNSEQTSMGAPGAVALCSRSRARGPRQPGPSVATSDASSCSAWRLLCSCSATVSSNRSVAARRRATRVGTALPSGTAGAACSCRMRLSRSETKRPRSSRSRHAATL